LIKKSEAREIFIKIVLDNYNNQENDTFDEPLVKSIFTKEDINEVANSFWDEKDKTKNDAYKKIVGSIIEQKSIK
jgi:hypothetical protein